MYVRIDDLMFRFQWHQQQEALRRGEPPPEPQPLTFDSLQELIHKPHLSAAEAVLLAQMLDELRQAPTSVASLDLDQVAALSGALRRRRAELQLTSTPEERLRDYAPGGPTPVKAEGPVLPLHTTILGEGLPEAKKAKD